VRKVINELKESDEVFLSELIWREFFIQILISIYFLPRVCGCKENYNAPWTRLKFFAVLTFVTAVLATSLSCMAGIDLLVSGSHTEAKVGYGLIVVGIAFYQFSWALLFLTCVMRIQSTLNNGQLVKYQMANRVYYFLYSLGICNVVFFLVMWLIITVFGQSLDDSTKESIYLLYDSVIYLLVLVIIPIANVVFLIVLKNILKAQIEYFVDMNGDLQLVKIEPAPAKAKAKVEVEKDGISSATAIDATGGTSKNGMQKVSNSTPEANTPRNESGAHSFPEARNCLIEPWSVENASRYTLLSAISAFSSAFFPFVAFIFYYSSSIKNDRPRSIKLSYAIVCVGFDQVFNAICVIFLFQFSTEHFHKFCACPLKCLERCCLRLLMNERHQKVLSTERDYHHLLFQRSMSVEYDEQEIVL
jgi:hypothetical protein